MRYSLDDTIVAIASPPGGGVRGIIRLSGPQVWGCLARCFIPQKEGAEKLSFLFGKVSSQVETPHCGWGLSGQSAFCASLSLGPELASEKQTVGFMDLVGSMSRPVVLQGELRLEGFFAGLPCELYWWPGPRSYTGGPVAEIHTLGSPPLLAAAIRTLCQAGARLAEPGEFTLRAFLSGRIDLTQAEAVLGVVDALNSQQLTAALEQLAGGLARPLQQLRNHLVELLVHLEAGLDFPDEDLPFLTRQQLAHQIQEARQQLHRLAEQLQTRRISAEGITVVLVGRPNVGKSSLFNALLGHQQAIVSPQPGTTRDYLTGPLDLGGLRCQLVDTAGLDWVELSASQWEKAEAEQQAGVLERLPQEGGAEKPSPGEQPSLRQRGAEKDIKPTALEVPLGTPPRGVSVEVAAQQMTLRQIQQADLLLWCVDASQPMDPQQWEELVRPGLQARLMVVTKADQPIRIDLQQLAARSGQEPILTSSRTGQGLQELRRRMQEILENLMSSGGHAVMATAIRSAESIRLAGEALDRALELTGQRCPEELVAAELRLALEEIGKVSGAVYTEDLLERIFSRFCIGK